MHLNNILFGATRRVMTGKHGNKNFYKGKKISVFFFTFNENLTKF